MSEAILTDKNIRNYMLAIAYNMTGSIESSKDILQDSYIKYLSAEAKVQKPKHYLKRIVINKSIDYLNQQKKTLETRYVGFDLATPVEDDFWENSELKIKTIDIATSLLFKKLTPQERAIFVLRNVYELKYNEISEVIDESEGYCRKIYSRLKPRLTNMSEENNQSYSSRKELIEKFLKNLQDNNLEGLKSTLKEDIKYYVDSGGKVKGASTNVIEGHKSVSEFILSRLNKITPVDSTYILKSINGSLSILNISENKIRLSIHIQVIDNLIDKIFIIANPDKLQYINV